MGASLSGIAAERTVTAIVAAQIGKRQEDFPRVCDDSGLELVARRPCSGQQEWKIVISAANQARRAFARNWGSGRLVREIGDDFGNWLAACGTGNRDHDALIFCISGLSALVLFNQRCIE